MRADLGSTLSYVPGHDPRRTAHILQHILANNLGSSLFLERKTYRIVFLRNVSSISFITGDQPVINMLDPKTTTHDVELCYPLSPNLAITLMKDSTKFPGRERIVNFLEVERYNYEIYSMSEDQLYSSDSDYLQGLAAIGKHALAS